MKRQELSLIFRRILDESLSCGLQTHPGGMMRLVDQYLKIGSQILDGGALTLSGKQGTTRLTLKATQVLVILAERAGHTVTREALLEQVWPGQFRTPDVLTQSIVELRRAMLGGDSRLVTVTKVGYRLQAEVVRLASSAPLSRLPLTGGPPNLRQAQHCESIESATASVDRQTTSQDGGCTEQLPFHFDAGSRTITAGPRVASLKPKASQVMMLLMEADGQVVTREQFFQRVWRGRVRTDDVLTQAIAELRRALQESACAARAIQTVPSIGYRLVRRPPSEPIRSSTPVMAIPGNRVGRLAQAVRTAVLAGGLGIMAYWLSSATVPADLSGTFAAPTAQPLTLQGLETVAFSDQQDQSPEIAPDGQRLAYLRGDPHSGHYALRLIDLHARSTSTLLDTTAYLMAPVWTSDSSHLLVAVADDAHCKLHQVPITGGPRLPLLECPGVPRFAHHQGHGHLALGLNQRGRDGMALSSLRLADGTGVMWDYPRAADDIDIEPVIASSGKVAFRRGLNPHSTLLILDPGDGNSLVAVSKQPERIVGHAWADLDGDCLIYSQGIAGREQLFAYDTRLAKSYLLASPGATNPTAFGKDCEGAVIAFEQSRRRTAVKFASPTGVSMNGWQSRTSGSDYAAKFSPDGSRVALISERSGAPQIWVIQENGAASMLESAKGTTPIEIAWSGAGDRVAALSRDVDGWLVVLINVSRGKPRTIWRTQQPLVSLEWGARAGQLLIGVQEANGFRVDVLRAAGEDWQPELSIPDAIRAKEMDSGDLVYASGRDRALRVRSRLGGSKTIAADFFQLWNKHVWTMAGDQLWLPQAQRDQRVVIKTLRLAEPSAEGEFAVPGNATLGSQCIDYGMAKRVLLYCSEVERNADIVLGRLRRSGQIPVEVAAVR